MVPPFRQPSRFDHVAGFFRMLAICPLTFASRLVPPPSIDHVLGFFRMWEIPVKGGGGNYYPSSGLREAGLKNLRAIQGASDMLICGEDLGNVPDEVCLLLFAL